MNTIDSVSKEILLRVIVISGIGILVGFILYPDMVFNPRMRAFQFVGSSVTAGIVYSFIKNTTLRNLLAALFAWYVILTIVVVRVNWWIPILNFVYIGGITGSIYLYNYLITKQTARNALLRILFAGAIVSVTNGLIIILLTMIRLKSFFSDITIHLKWTLHNMKLGAVIGIAVGTGIELAEYISGKYNDDEHDQHTEIDVSNTQRNNTLIAKNG